MLSCRRPSFSYLFERRSCSSIVLHQDGEIEQIAALVHTNCVNVSNAKVRILGEKVLNIVSFGVLRLFHVPVNLTSYHIVKFQLAKRFHLENESTDQYHPHQAIIIIKEDHLPLRE